MLFFCHNELPFHVSIELDTLVPLNNILIEGHEPESLYLFTDSREIL